MPTMNENPYQQHHFDLLTHAKYSRENFPPLSVAGQRYAKMAFHDLVMISHGVSFVCGWHHNPQTGEPIERNVGEMIALMHSELSEAMEGHRKRLMDDKLPNRLMVEVEMADLLHRVLDFCGRFGLDIGGAYIEKALYNLNREDHKAENRNKEGGKAY